MAGSGLPVEQRELCGVFLTRLNGVETLKTGFWWKSSSSTTFWSTFIQHEVKNSDATSWKLLKLKCEMNKSFCCSSSPMLAVSRLTSGYEAWMFFFHLFFIVITQLKPVAFSSLSFHTEIWVLFCKRLAVTVNGTSNISLSAGGSTSSQFILKSRRVADFAPSAAARFSVMMSISHNGWAHNPIQGWWAASLRRQLGVNSEVEYSCHWSRAWKSLETAASAVVKARWRQLPKRVLGTRSDSPSNYCRYALGQPERLSALFGHSALAAADAAALLLAIGWLANHDGRPCRPEASEEGPSQLGDSGTSSLLSPACLWLCNVAFGWPMREIILMFSSRT